jgi:hypothetical protein
MKQHEREFLVSMIRTGKVFININDISLVIHPLTIDQAHLSCEIYNNAYQQAYIDGMMDEDEMSEWMELNGLWSKTEEDKSERFKKDLERLKVEIYNARNDSGLKEKIRLYLREGEKQFAHHLSKKNTYYQNTREGVAATEKVAWTIRNSTYCNDKLYDFSEVELTYVVDEWQSSFLTDSQSRDLARNEPWKSLWLIRENTKIQLFNNPQDSELTYNQKNLIIWSQMYDNIQESLDCPTKEAIDDDDVLDGWFIIQAKKREQEKFEQEVSANTKNEKIKNASEVFMVAKNEKDAVRINESNSIHSQSIKRQREAMIKRKGTVAQHNFPDERLNIQAQQNSQFKGKFKGG